MKFTLLSAALFSTLLFTGTAEAGTICTLVLDAKTGTTLMSDGDCKTRVTPASTFKVPLAVIGFDSGFLKTPHEPLLDNKDPKASWGGAPEKVATDPTAWLKHSVIWYSQKITHELGAGKLTRYGTELGLGNADFSGDKGKNNGLDRSWIGSSLKISPQEQAAFTRKLVNGTLPVTPEAMTLTRQSVESSKVADGWTVHGKTGAAFPRLPDGSFDRAHGWGWFVGWATKGERTIIFTRLVQDEKAGQQSAGVRTKGDMLKNWPQFVAGFGG
ncbi:class D beta-lactamase [Mesorhizobium sp. NBSH29]|uniref:class D beta-lactamase n=1 Tax=Mesorhizobium sp. NBSH29 TaxID=2654249 RepID=UPI0018965EEE|nr:class D beta-lactamase [Mesorhizobium sp. NBSH29]QPC85470.1 class D beta-lactamase [Mesorhizobium sp. NBSH29]